MKVSPVARTESLIVKEVDGETLVYDLKLDKAHCLNDTAARIWKNCDGHNTVSDIAALLGREAGVEVRDEVIWMALDQLKKLELLDDTVTAVQPSILAGMTRRQAVRAFGVAAVVLPMVTTLLVPNASAQASFPCCQNDTDCLSGQCCNPLAVCLNLPSQKQCVSKISGPPGLCP
jgi:hypothetical protein